MSIQSSKQKSASAADAVRQSRELQLEVDALRAEVQDLRSIAHALWDIVREQTGISENDFLQRVTTIADASKPRLTVAATCPACSRSLQKKASHCIYCGEAVERRQVF